MKKLTLFFAPLLLTFSLPLLLSATKPPVVKWTVKNPFEQKVFIENKGQYAITGRVPSANILFGARCGDLQYYFTNHSVWIKKFEAVKRTEQEIEQFKQQFGLKESGEKDDKELRYKMMEEFHQMEFAGANPKSQITADNEVSWYYNFTLANHLAVRANAFKKLTYHNLYPGIDMEFYFRDDTTGFEYSFIIHPGADISQLKIQYPLNTGLRLKTDGNMVITSSYGNFTDHAPVATQSGKTVGCFFTLTNSTIQFKTGDYDKTKTLVIDPWSVTPAFTTGDNGYNIDYDHAGNCYVYGGSYPWQVIKYDNNGNQLWIYTEAFPNTLPIYGHFAVDKTSQSVYLVDGCDPPGATVIKLNSSGAQIAESSGDFSFNEMWRIAFSQCTNEAVIAGGGSFGEKQACFLDTTLTSLNPVNVLNTSNPYHDMWGLALDNYGYCYMIAAYDQSDAAYNNTMIKVPVSASLAPTVWGAATGYSLVEVGSLTYNHSSASGWQPNGFSGMTVSDTIIYTYDSHVLKNWSSASGANKKSVTLDGGGAADVSWGGLTSDNCDNIFLGEHDWIYQYNAALQKTDSMENFGTVYDVALSTGGLLYACGIGFVSAIQFNNVPSCSFGILTVNNPTICNGGTAVLKASGSSSYSWSPSAGLSATTGDSVTVNVTTTTTYTLIGISCNHPDTIQAIVTVGSAPPIAIEPQSPIICNGQTVSLSISGGSGYTWSPSSTLSSSTGNTVVATPAATTTYTVMGTNSGGCTSTGIDTVIIGPTPPLSINPQSPILCNGQVVTLLVTNSGANFTWSPSTALNTTTGQSVIASPTADITYTVTGMDSVGCAATGTDDVSVVPAPNKPTITVSVTGDSLISSATQGNQWYFNDTSIAGATNQILVINPQKKGAYFVIVINPANGCTATSDSLILTGINQLSQISNQLSIYPNPFNSNIFITINSSAQDVKDWSFKLTDVLGRTLLTKPSLNYSNDIDLSNLPGSVYFITIINKTERAVFPAVKQ